MSDDMGDRFKDYERRATQYLPRRSYVIVRVDGHNFHGLTLEKPFDEEFILSMNIAAMLVFLKFDALLAYVQSDEASFLLTDTRRLETQPIYNYRTDKLTSIMASQMGVGFTIAFGKAGIFDARCFTVPEDDVANYFLWRAKDWARNSLQMLTRAHYSQKECHKRGQVAMHNMLHKKGINWTELPQPMKNGSFIYHEYGVEKLPSGRRKKEMTLDANIQPVFVQIDKRLQDILEHYRE